MDEIDAATSLIALPGQVILLGTSLVDWLEEAKECSDESTRAESIARAKETIFLIMDIAASAVFLQQGDSK